MSYLDIIADAINASGGMPSYNDFQTKIDYKPNIYNTFSILVIAGGSLYDRDKKGALDVGESEYGELKNNQLTIGINYKRIWNEKAYSNTSLSISNKYSKVNFSNINTDTLVFKNIEEADIFNFRQINHIKIASQTNLEFGFDAQWTTQYYDYLRKLNNSNILLDKIKFDQKVSISNYSAFFTVKKNLGRKLISSIGLRTDLNDYENTTLISPRINLDYEIVNSKTNLIFNIGDYYQNPPAIYVANKTSDRLKSARARQYSVCLEHMITASTKFSVSAYQKDYNNSPILPNSNLHNDPTFLFDELRMYNGIVSEGSASSKGLEVLIQKKRVENFYGLIGGSIFNSTFIDFEGIERNRNHNYRYIFNIVGGYRPKSDWELSIRWSYFGGRPYTPINLEASISDNEQYSDVENFNENKTPDYHSLFVRYERRYNLKKSNLILFFEIWNTYNRENIETFFFSKERDSIEKILYFSTIPVGGFGIEF